MQCRRFTHLIIAGLIGLGWISESQAQTITTGALAVTQICGPATISVPFTQTGTFNAGNAFSVQLSNSSGDFTAPLVLSPSGAASPLVVTIPGTVENGANYKVRVVSSNPAVVGTTGPTALSIQQTPAPPTVAQTTYSYCQNAPATALSATASGGNTLQWYDGSNAPLASAPTPSTASAGTQNYSVSQKTSNGCESSKVAISVQVNAIPAAPTATSPVELCQGAGAAPLTATGDNLQWYAASSGGSPLAGAPTPSTAAAGTTSYFVSQTVNGCERPRKDHRRDRHAQARPPRRDGHLLLLLRGRPSRP